MEKDFFEKVYEVVRQIPEGKVTSYGAIAEYLGLKKSARMVGWALNKSFKKSIPAHRVVNRKGILTGKNHFQTPFMMQELLEKEGITVINDKIINFEKHFWHPFELNK